MTLLKLAATVFSVWLAGCLPTVAGTLESVRAKGFVQCGVNSGLTGFAAADSDGVWHGLDVDVCRAVAAAVLGDAGKARFVPLSTQRRLAALKAGEVDILTRNTTWTLGRDAGRDGVTFTTPNYYDGQGFLVAKARGVKTVKGLSGATVCVLAGTTSEQNLADWSRANRMGVTPLPLDGNSEIENAFFGGRCAALTADASQLAAIRASAAPRPEDYVILPDLISKEPLTPAVRDGDDAWADVVRWVQFAMVAAEEMGVGRDNVGQMLTSDDPDIRRLLGVVPGNGRALGLDERWAYAVIRQVGNYGESFDRNLGRGSRLRMERGLNALYTQGGLMYAPPLR